MLPEAASKGSTRRASTNRYASPKVWPADSSSFWHVGSTVEIAGAVALSASYLPLDWQPSLHMLMSASFDPCALAIRSQARKHPMGSTWGDRRKERTRAASLATDSSTVALIATPAVEFVITAPKSGSAS